MFNETYSFFFFNDTATTEIYTLSLHDALPISGQPARDQERAGQGRPQLDRRQLHCQLHADGRGRAVQGRTRRVDDQRSEEHTSELQSRQYLVCRLLLEKKKKQRTPTRVLLHEP